MAIRGRKKEPAPEPVAAQPPLEQMYMARTSGVTRVGDAVRRYQAQRTIVPESDPLRIKYPARFRPIAGGRPVREAPVAPVILEDAATVEPATPEPESSPGETSVTGTSEPVDLTIESGPADETTTEGVPENDA